MNFRLSLIVILIVVTSSSFYPQNEGKRWGKKEIDYTVNAQSSIEVDALENQSAAETLTYYFVKSYKALISDHDGDLCAFNPSCSLFFLQAVKETNLPQGLLMFADRFTRDANFIGRESRYPKFINGKYYDPPRQYMLGNKNIQHLSLSKIVTDD